MSSKSSLAFNTIIVLIGNIVNSVVYFFIPIILVRFLSQYEYGTYRQLMLIYYVLLYLLMMGIPTSIYYFIPKIQKNEIKSFVLQSVVLLTLLGGVIAMLAFFLSDYIAGWFNNADLAPLINLMSISFIFGVPLGCINPLAFCLNKHKSAVTINLLYSILVTASFIIPAVLKYSLKEMMFCFLISGIIQYLMFLSFIFNNLKGPFKGSYPLLKSQLKFSLPAGVNDFMGNLQLQIDKFFVSIYNDPGQYAIYSVGARELPFINLISYSVLVVIQPKLVEYYDNHEYDNYKKLWHNAIFKVSIVILPVFFFFQLMAEELIVVIYTQDYIGGNVAFRFFLFFLIIRVLALNTVLLTLGMSKELMFSTILFILLNSGLSIILIYLVGMNGAALSLILSSILLSLYLVQMIMRKMNLNINNVLPWKLLGQLILISVVSLFFVIPVKFYFSSPILVLMLSFTIYTFVYIAACLYAQILRKEDLISMGSMIRDKIIKK